MNGSTRHYQYFYRSCHPRIKAFGSAGPQMMHCKACYGVSGVVLVHIPLFAGDSQLALVNWTHTCRQFELSFASELTIIRIVLQERSAGGKYGVSSDRK